MKNKNILPLLAVAVVLALVFSYWDNIKLAFAKAQGKMKAAAEGETKEFTAPDGTKTTVSTAAQSLYRAKPSGNTNQLQVLQRGVTSPAVWDLQNMLVQMHGKQIVVDGIFGPNTEKALHEVTGKKSTTLSGFLVTYSKAAGQAAAAAMAAAAGGFMPVPIV